MSTTIWEQALELYGRTNINLERDIIEYARDGYVFVAPTYLLIGRGVGDGWYIQAAIGVGAMQRFTELMPYYLPYIGWRREGKHSQECVWYRTEAVIRKVNQYARRTTSTTQATSPSNEGPGGHESIGVR